MTASPSTWTELRESRRRFLDLVADLRPDLHRYCARMTGGVADGEDVVQETLAHAYYALADLEAMPALRPWLFRIAHNRAIDHLRRRGRAPTEPLETISEVRASDAPDAEEELAREQAVQAAVSRFVDLPPAQRSVVVLKDVLGHSLEEIAALLELSVPAVKSALHRGRSSLRALARAAPPPVPAASPEMARFVALFNARRWDEVRALLAEDVKLDVVTKSRRAGRAQVSSYFDNYARLTDWFLRPAWLEGREVIAAWRDPQHDRPDYFIELTMADGRITAIRDFRYVPYAAREAEIVTAQG